MLYPLLVAALLPLSLREGLACLPAMTERLEPPDNQIEQLQVPRFRAALAAGVRREIGC